MMTKEGLRNSLFACLEFGYKARERNLNIQAAMEACRDAINRVVEESGLRHEVVKIHTLNEQGGNNGTH